MKRSPLVLCLIITLTPVVILVQSNLAFAALPQVAINSDGTVTPSDIPLNHVGNTYYFTANILNHSIKINCDNIILDGQGFTLQGRPDSIGLYLINRNNVTIRNLNIKSYLYGIQMIANYLTSEPNTGINVINNTITDCSHGVLFAGAINGSISGNKILNNDYGIGIKGHSSFNVINENVITNNGWGIYVDLSDNNTFTLNTISKSELGIRICHSQENIFARNNLTDNNAGLLFKSLVETFDDLYKSNSKNLFYNNNFINNSRHVSEEFKHGIPLPQSNVWDDGARGNYWDDYSARYPNASEIGNSGIGDTPYAINADNIDHYPLMKPADYAAPSIRILSPENKTYNTSSVPLNFTVNEATSQITYSLDGRENVTIAGNTTLTGLANGCHNLTVYAKDESGNTGSSETIYFSVDVPFPTALVAATSAGLVSVVGVGLLVYFRKIKKKTV